ncbi:linoleate 13S-lipoxygenase 2-1, chloroplastic-like [Olea europaea subsp. europaea]|uniref:Linoleate 13S-lipoxygenase 2-1, chloroplastic-like n=1 Tax=Olea europaea subsp. europaea TaxID=158383 RepID=A0A8S0UB15_OLEEU|nr:linoleate 13S-lipoxygenase 2-1, chloroplastic-like [Olea europaea subsp. europaea]
MEVSSVAYDQFNLQALPADLISRQAVENLISYIKGHAYLFNMSQSLELNSFVTPRGMAVEDSNAPCGLKLKIDDYPYARDGLLIWDAIKQCVTGYVTYYYPQANLVKADNELQAW